MDEFLGIIGLVEDQQKAKKKQEEALEKYSDMISTTNDTTNIVGGTKAYRNESFIKSRTKEDNFNY